MTEASSAIKVFVYDVADEDYDSVKEELKSTGQPIRLIRIDTGGENPSLRMVSEKGESDISDLDEMIEAVETLAPTGENGAVPARPGVDEITVEIGSEGVTANLWPNSYVEITHQREQTEKSKGTDKPIFVDLGVMGGKDVPVNIYYGDNYDLDQVLDKADVLFGRKEACPLCARKRAEIYHRFKSIVDGTGTDEEKTASVEKMIADLKAEVDQAKAERDEARAQKGLLPPPPLEPPIGPQHHWAGEKYDYLYDKHDKMLSSVHGVHEANMNLIKQIFTPPKLPAFQDLFAQERKRYLEKTGQTNSIEKESMQEIPLEI